jgi:hypothetical protein
VFFDRIVENRTIVIEKLGALELPLVNTPWFWTNQPHQLNPT